MRNISLRQLRAVAAICNEGRTVLAAQALGLTPPAVTLQLKQLEEEAGLALFDRTPDGMRPTNAGLLMLAAAQAVEAELRILSDSLDAIRGVRRGALRLGVVSTAKYFAPRMMAGFKADHPGIEMKLFVGNRAETIRSLRDHAIDMAIMGRPPLDLQVRAIVFGDHPLVIIAAPDHPLAQARDIPKERIAQEDFLVRERGSGTRTSMEIFMRDAPDWLEREPNEMNSNETIKQAVMAGLGVAFISAHTVASELESERLALLDVVGMPVRRQWFAVTRADRALTPVMAEFNRFLIARGASFLPLLTRLYPEPRIG